MTCDFYQATHVKDLWNVKFNTHGFNVLGMNYWYEYVKCYVLHQVMWQKEEFFMSILIKFRTFQTLKM
jgi:hypothetical protein